MRRKNGSLVPLEVSILETALELRMRGHQSFHGFLLAKEIKDRQDARLLIGHGTLYRALDRLLRAGLLENEWEDPLVAASESRPRRRFYWITAAGEAALSGQPAQVPSTPQQRRLATS